MKFHADILEAFPGICVVEGISGQFISHGIVQGSKN